MTRAPTEMELRVAKALDDVIDGWYDAQSNLNTVDLARAAIRAMRQPTEEMMGAVAGDDIGTGDAWYVFTGMIDAASPQEE